jgi:hypothetical protein
VKGGADLVKFQPVLTVLLNLASFRDPRHLVFQPALEG